MVALAGSSGSPSLTLQGGGSKRGSRVGPRRASGPQPASGGSAPLRSAQRCSSQFSECCTALLLS